MSFTLQDICQQKIQNSNDLLQSYRQIPQRYNFLISTVLESSLVGFAQLPRDAEGNLRLLLAQNTNEQKSTLSVLCIRSPVYQES
jgi:hypothetical protein